jgi:hypothetical protein
MTTPSQIKYQHFTKSLDVNTQTRKKTQTLVLDIHPLTGTKFSIGIPPVGPPLNRASAPRGVTIDTAAIVIAARRPNDDDSRVGTTSTASLLSSVVAESPSLNAFVVVVACRRTRASFEDGRRNATRVVGVVVGVVVSAACIAVIRWFV